MDIIIKPLIPELEPDFLLFFDTIAFADNPDWDSCYCHFFYIPDNNVWRLRTGEENRRDSITRIREQRMHGFLAYLGGKPVGFCNADDKTNYPRLVAQKELWGNSKKRTASIVCFVISHFYRRKGIASHLLEAVCNYYAKRKYAILEAYPRKNVTTDAEHYYGPLSMYIKQGFSIAQEFDDFCKVEQDLGIYIQSIKI